MKTLVIHPDDRTTDFLKEIYRDKDYTVINHNATAKELKDAIKSHGRIMMLGHGSQHGLIGYCRMIINSSYVQLLREKLCVGIWCNADKFFNKYKLTGFFTGMFISEVGEASVYGISITQEKIDFSNEYFASEFRKYESMITVHQLIKEHYNSFDCPVIQFNNQRFYELNEESFLAERDLDEEMRDFTDDLSDNEQPSGMFRGSFNLDGSHI